MKIKELLSENPYKGVKQSFRFRDYIINVIFSKENPLNNTLDITITSDKRTTGVNVESHDSKYLISQLSQIIRIHNDRYDPNGLRINKELDFGMLFNNEYGKGKMNSSVLFKNMPGELSYDDNNIIWSANH